MASRLILVLSSSVMVHVNAGAVELTKANFEEQVFNSGKNAFVKFLAPW